MEVSSHALVQHRADAIVFDVVAFTNLSHDHLDFHGTMEQYFAAKALLFEPDRARRAVVWVDNPWGARLFGALRVPGTPVSAGDATDVQFGVGRTTFTWRDVAVELPMTGQVNVANALVAAEVAVSLGVDPVTVAAGLASARPVPGRLELVPGPGPGSPTVLVDYAHTPAALELALEEARRVAAPDGGRVIVVIGCGGDRDQGKRPLMGEVAARAADIAVMTSDNPRHEDPDRIIDQILAGMPGPRDQRTVVVEPDRWRAIEAAVGMAGPGDVVLLAGKGHETTQELAGTTVPFDDRLVAAAALGSPPADPAGRLAG
jgi:UDP-N-acetylmuramoyl-L-alanyl-D-glutamate--2,6-diaminopimelate ligase